MLLPESAKKEIETSGDMPSELKERIFASAPWLRRLWPQLEETAQEIVRENDEKIANSLAQETGLTGTADSFIQQTNGTSNTFGINFKQIFQAGNNFAGLNIAGVSTDPNSANLQPGDLWFNTGSNHLNFRDGSGNTKALAFAGDAASGDGSGLTNLNASQLSSGTVPAGRLSGTYGISGNAASITGSIPESQVTNLATARKAASAPEWRICRGLGLQNKANKICVFIDLIAGFGKINPSNCTDRTKADVFTKPVNLVGRTDETKPTSTPFFKQVRCA